MSEIQKKLEDWLRNAESSGVLKDNKITATERGVNKGLLYPKSIHRYLDNYFGIGSTDTSDFLLITGTRLKNFDGQQVEYEGSEYTFCNLEGQNSASLREIFPFIAPSCLSNAGVSFGVGDRLGVASPGHIRIFDKYNASPVLAQQSLRELDLTNRTYSDIVNQAGWAVFQEDFQKPWAADGDHLMEERRVRDAVRSGCTMVTADLSQKLNLKYCDPNEVLGNDYQSVEKELRKRIERRYSGSPIKLSSDVSLEYTDEDIVRAALIYKDSIDLAERLYQAAVESGRAVDFEVSIDETPTPTLPIAHFLVAEELKYRKIPVCSIAPRFVGEFQKGIDYIGNIDMFKRDFKLHTAVANHFGHKISVHSGSDKFSVFGIIGEYTDGRFHLKTSGTNWLVAMKVIAQAEPEFYRKLHKYAEKQYPITSTYYYITPDMNIKTDIDSLEDKELVNVFSNPTDRQVLHISYGEILKDPNLRKEIYKLLYEKREDYWQALSAHIEKHFSTLGISQI